VDEILSAIEDDGLRRLYAYWDVKRAGRRFPARRDIDPVDLSFVLGWIILLDVTYDPLRFRVRLYGSELAARTEHDLTGVYADEHPWPEFSNYVQSTWTEVVASGKPNHGFFDRTLDNRKLRFEALRLPLSSDGERIDMLLVCVRYRT
jgi:hypothetical protein